MATATVPRVAVIGGGISGVAAAHRLWELHPDWEIRLFEGSDRLGGVLETEQHGPFQVELGSDSFITNKPAALELAKRIGFEDELIPTNDQFRRTFVVCRGRLEQVPDGFLLMSATKIWPILTTPILSWPGKIRLAWEYFVAKKPPGDESLASFGRRRLGKEAYERIVQPLVGGIYTADDAKLSLQATLPRFLEMEQRAGSLIRAARKQDSQHKNNSGARYSLFVTPKRGLSSFVEAIADRLPAGSILRGQAVTSCTRKDDRWQLEFASSHQPAQQFDAVIFAVPAPQAAKIATSFDEALAEALHQIPYAGAAVVTLGYKREQIRHPLNGFGFVVPEVEGRRILACSFSSVKFAGRAPEEYALLRVFIGGAKHPEYLEKSDEELTQIVDEELSELLGIAGGPELRIVGRYANKMPQYHIGHLEVVARVEQQVAQWPGLQVAGNAYHGVGIPDCIASAEKAAQAIAEMLSQAKV